MPELFILEQKKKTVATDSDITFCLTLNKGKTPEVSKYTASCSNKDILEIYWENSI